MMIYNPQIKLKASGLKHGIWFLELEYILKNQGYEASKSKTGRRSDGEQNAPS